LAVHEAHRGNLLLLRDDDLLRHASKLLVVAVAELGLCHLDRALVVRNHLRDEIGVRIAGRCNRDASHHGRHGCSGFGQEGRLFRVVNRRGARRDWLSCKS